MVATYARIALSTTSVMASTRATGASRASTRADRSTGSFGIRASFLVSRGPAASIGAAPTDVGCPLLTRLLSYRLEPAEPALSDRL
jgi:hypothetical protein